MKYILYNDFKEYEIIHFNNSRRGLCGPYMMLLVDYSTTYIIMLLDEYEHMDPDEIETNPIHLYLYSTVTSTISEEYYYSRNLNSSDLYIIIR